MKSLIHIVELVVMKALAAWSLTALLAMGCGSASSSDDTSAAADTGTPTPTPTATLKRDPKDNTAALDERTDGEKIVSSITPYFPRIPIKVSISASLPAEYKQAYLNAMDTWEAATGKDLFEAVEVDLPLVTKSGDYAVYDWPLGEKNRSQTPMNYILGTASMCAFPAIPGTIGVCSYEPIGEVTSNAAKLGTFNNSNIIVNTAVYGTGKAIYPTDPETVALHLVARMLGFEYVHLVANPNYTYSGNKFIYLDPDSIMRDNLWYSSTAPVRRVPSLDDMKKLQNIYGCSGSACDRQGTRAARVAKKGG